MTRRKCAVCGSKQWRKEPSSSLVTCSEGHVLQNYRNESIAIDQLGPHAMHKRTLRSGRKRKERESKVDPKLYHGDRGRYHYFQCQQLILRMQIQWLTKEWNLPREYEMVCRDLWALHVSLLPNPPTPSPFLFRQDLVGGQGHQPQSGQQAIRGVVFDMGEASDTSSSTSSADSETEGDVAALLREASESDSGSSDEEQDAGSHGPAHFPSSKTQRPTHSAYDSPTANIAVLVLGCWMLRIPITYMDFIRVINSYDLIYLDPVRLLPADIARHLTKQTVQAMSPRFAPRPAQIHGLVSRLAMLINQRFSILAPELNIAPLLWRVVRVMEGNPTLYILAKKLARVLLLPLTLHPLLAPALERDNPRDPSWHKYDGVPIEVSLVSLVIVIQKLVYGLDGFPRMPGSRSDPAHALPRLAAVLTGIQKAERDEAVSKEHLVLASRDWDLLALDGGELDAYIDFCERALSGQDGRDIDHVDIAELFPIRQCSPVPGGMPKAELSGLNQPSFPQSYHENPSRCTGQEYAIYSAMDILGTLPEDYDVIIRRAACWTGVPDEFIHSVVENLEVRLVRWWERVQRQAQGIDA